MFTLIWLVFKFVLGTFAVLAVLYASAITTSEEFAPELNGKRAGLWAWNIFFLVLMIFVGSVISSIPSLQTNAGIFWFSVIACYAYASYPLMRFDDVTDHDVTINEIFKRIKHEYKLPGDEPEKVLSLEQWVRKNVISPVPSRYTDDKMNKVRSYVSRVKVAPPSSDEYREVLLAYFEDAPTVIKQIIEDFVDWTSCVHIPSFAEVEANFDQRTDDPSRYEYLVRMAETYWVPNDKLLDKAIEGFERLESSLIKPQFLSLADEGLSIAAHMKDGNVNLFSFTLRDYQKRLMKLRFKINSQIPENLRYEHHFILGGTGHGKSYTMQSMILDDLETDASIVVLDSQRNLVNEILHAVPVDRLVHIDPTDPEYLPAINLFDSKQDAELYHYMFSALGAEMTANQKTMFGYLARLLEVVPNATIHTMRKMLEKGGIQPYEKYIGQLSETAQAFFRNELLDPRAKQYERTRQEILTRLYTMLENDTFAGMFGSTKTKIDIGAEMAAGKVILIDTAKGHLGAGFALFGRFWIAQIAKAMFQGRVGKTYLYIDEAHEYFSDEEMLTELFVQARKFNVGLIVATQFLGQIPVNVRQAILSNTSIKFIGGVSAADTRVMATEMRCEPEFILEKPKGTFAAYYKGQGTTSYRASMKKYTKRSQSELDEIRSTMREKYYSPIATHTNQDIVVGEPVDEEEVEETGEW